MKKNTMNNEEVIAMSEEMISAITEEIMRRLTAKMAEKNISAPIKEDKKAAPRKPASTQKEAEKMILEKENKVAEPTPKPTYADAIEAWKVKKYGSIATANKVQEMTKVVAAEWAAKARETGKYVVPRKQYKDKLYEEAYRRVKEAEDQEAEIKKETPKKAPTKKNATKKDTAKKVVETKKNPQIGNIVATEMYQEAKASGKWWTKAEYKAEFNRRVAEKKKGVK